MSQTSSPRPSRRAAAFMLTLALFGSGASAACGGDETPAPADEPATEDGVDADLVPGDADNGQNTDPGDQAPGAQVGGDGSDEEDTITDDE